MFGNWLRWWLKAVFWWVQEADENVRSGQTEQPRHQSARDAAWSPDQNQKTEESKSQPVETVSEVADDLTEIKGIGPSLTQRLNAIGITTFAELAAADPEHVASKINLGSVTSKRVRDWIQQAKRQSS